MRILFITEIAPFPVNGGEKLRSYGLLKLLAELDIDVHAVIGKCDDNDFGKYGLDKLDITEFKFVSYNTFGKPVRYQKLFSKDKKLVHAIENVMQARNFDLVYIDYFFYGQYIPYFKKIGLPVIYGTHNAQANLIYQRPAVSFKNKISMFIELQVNKFHESHYFKKADALIVVSENDAEYHARFMGREKIYTIPNFLIDEEYPPTKDKKEDYIVMTANFMAYQNAAGLEWFIKEVWDDELAKKIKLQLVGMGSDKVFAELKEKYPMQNITAIGEVDDLKPYIRKARASIVPLLHGSGSRLKCLESMALKTQLISTSKGCEGIDHFNSVVVADTPLDFKAKIMKVWQGEIDTSKEAHDAYLKTYSLSANKKKFDRIIQSVMN